MLCAWLADANRSLELLKFYVDVQAFKSYSKEDAQRKRSLDYIFRHYFAGIPPFI